MNKPQKTGSRGGLLMVHLTVRLTTALNGRLEKMARKSGISKTQVVREAIDTALCKKEMFFGRFKKGNKK